MSKLLQERNQSLSPINGLSEIDGREVFYEHCIPTGFRDRLLRGLILSWPRLASAEALGYFHTSTTRTEIAPLLSLRPLQQLFQIPLPDRRNRVRAVAACLVADRNHDDAAALDAFDLTLDDSQLRGIDEIVGGVDGDEWRFYRFEFRRWIVFA